MLAKNLEGELQYFCDHIYDDSTDGYLQVIKLKKEKINIVNTSNKHLREVVFEYINTEDTYISINTTFIPKRETKNIRQFRALYIDIDLKENDFKNSIVYDIFWLANEGKIPKPTMVVSSGVGLHIYWKIKNAPYGAMNTWQQLEDFLYFQLKHLGADIKATDCVRVLRLVSTINSKNNKLCELMYLDKSIEYSMYDLREEYLNWKTKGQQLQFQETKIKTNKIIHNTFFNSYSLHFQRAEDLVTLVRIREYKVTGYRNMIIHCYAYWRGLAVRNEEDLMTEVIELNNSFTEPLKDSEITAVCRCVLKKIDEFITYENELRAGLKPKPKLTKGMKNKPGYWYKNDTLIERLEITEQEQKELKTIISKEEKYSRRRISDKERKKAKRRNKDGSTKREQQKQDLINKVKELKLQGLRQIEIAEELKITKGTVSKYLKF